MRAALDYLFYCFYCLTAENHPNRSGASRRMLSLFVVFTLMNAYAFIISLTISKFHFFAAVLVCVALAESLLYYTYYRPQAYAPLVARYAQGEPERLRYALTGGTLTLGVFFLPFLFIKLRHL